jgi:hypothetical protein
MYGSLCSSLATRTAAAMWVQLSAKAGKSPVSKQAYKRFTAMPQQHQHQQQQQQQQQKQTH